MLAGLTQQLLDGLTLGVVYVLLAAGLSVIFGVMHVINFAHGELFALGAYFALAVIAPLGGTAFFAALLIAPLLVGVIGVAIERYTVQPLYGRNPLYHILLTFGLVLVLNDLIYLVWGPGASSLPRPDVVSGTISVFGFGVSAYNLFIIVAGSLMAVAVWAMLEYTRYGLIIRAGSQDRQMVRNLGIDIDRYYSLVFGVGAALAAFAGIILAGSRQVNPEMGMSVIIPAFVIVVLGGLGSFKGAVAGGLFVGILQESILRPYVPFLEGMVLFLLMIGILLVRPRGLFGTETPDDEGGELLTGSNGGFLDPKTRNRLGVAMVGLLVLVPFGAGWLYSTFVVTLLIEVLIWGLFALSLDFVMGYTGLVSLGHALFYGLGAYVVAITLQQVTPSVFVALPLAIVISAAVAWVVGYLSIRVSGVYFAMITLAFAELFYNAVTRLEITGGSEGIFGLDPVYGIGGVGVELDSIGLFLGPVAITGRLLFYYVVLLALVAGFLLTRRMLQSPFGAVLTSIRENEQRATFLGYDTVTYKRRAFVVSGALAGLSGGLYTLFTGRVFPATAEWMVSGEVIVMVILGGMGTLYGPIVGSATFFGLEYVLTGVTERWRLVLGSIFVLFVIFLPRGLVSVPELLAPHLPGGPGPDPEPATSDSSTRGDD
ncbi:ABC transporter permease [Natronobacterium gregoryi]|uniref:Branched-chain amino acid ABC transporter permease n=2 Tax=Natronobacterium gregoryi TaxID=44930 RepID=L0AEW8_NATGS|nr:ABC transporter permease [Natronobacterium gregoryi]AFZ72463.1 branched-chain amino acid ABC-type transport system, permease component [Natronobacterium gregoryi SP2]ELY74333.1 inner-membrane translocator [Natronobacterium gregoryi SP2]PLK21435.1 branched-chain amino acid ABC transporter permease [Natronobacterium gregoryi SP2]SFI77888.1 amino acid/amide ABC transporter membrane protein 1, HAAT family /amino acid/amide ABC transporter membrane protein 2, HAAT family [Natronobacterium gregory